MYRTALPALALSAAAAAFGACGLSLALLGLGLPFGFAALLSAACAGLLTYALGRWAIARAALPRHDLATDLLVKEKEAEARRVK